MVVKAVAEEARSNDNSGAVLVSFMLLLGLLEDDRIRREIVSSISSLSAAMKAKSFCGELKRGGRSGGRHQILMMTYLKLNPGITIHF